MSDPDYGQCSACGAQCGNTDALTAHLADEHPGMFDTAGSASRQHYIDTGRYLRVGEEE